MKISFSLRAFIVYFVILATLSWFIIDKATERLNVALRQSAESVLVDTANLLATSLEHEFQSADQTLDTWEISRLFSDAYQRKVNAQIYNVLKDKVETEVYVTDHAGVVVYDSSGQHTGEDFSDWRDVSLTLAGEYGARTSFRDQTKTEENDEKIMVISAPIRHQQKIVGVIGVVKPIRILEAFLVGETKQLKQYAIGLLALAMVLGYIASHGFTAATEKLANYARDMAAGRKVIQPQFLDKRFSRLAAEIANLREQVDGKSYVEEYVHSLTHELKTPLTAIQASSELLSENLPEAERERFLQNIKSSNQRMAKLVDRMLSLARLEGMPQINSIGEIDLGVTINELVEERRAVIDARNLQVTVGNAETTQAMASGDPLLITQAIANLIDNAIERCAFAGEIILNYSVASEGCFVEVYNSGDMLDDFVLERAFDRFFSMPVTRGNSPADSDLPSSKSTGLGLSFVKEIMLLHDGQASLKNITLKDRSGVEARLWWPRQFRVDK